MVHRVSSLEQFRLYTMLNHFYNVVGRGPGTVTLCWALTLVQHSKFRAGGLEWKIIYLRSKLTSAFFFFKYYSIFMGHNID